MAASVAAVPLARPVIFLAPNATPVLENVSVVPLLPIVVAPTAIFPEPPTFKEELLNVAPLDPPICNWVDVRSVLPVPPIFNLVFVKLEPVVPPTVIPFSLLSLICEAAVVPTVIGASSAVVIPAACIETFEFPPDLRLRPALSSFSPFALSDEKPKLPVAVPSAKTISLFREIVLYFTFSPVASFTVLVPRTKLDVSFFVPSMSGIVR